MATQRFSLENVKESVLKIRSFTFDIIFSIENIINWEKLPKYKYQ